MCWLSLFIYALGGWTALKETLTTLRLIRRRCTVDQVSTSVVRTATLVVMSKYGGVVIKVYNTEPFDPEVAGSNDGVLNIFMLRGNWLGTVEYFMLRCNWLRTKETVIQTYKFNLWSSVTQPVLLFFLLNDMMHNHTSAPTLVNALQSQKMDVSVEILSLCIFICIHSLGILPLIGASQVQCRSLKRIKQCKRRSTDYSLHPWNVWYHFK